MSEEFFVEFDKKSVSATVDPHNTTILELIKQVGADQASSYVIKKNGKELFKYSKFSRNNLNQKLSELTEDKPKYQPKMTRMFFPTSGKSGFQFFQGNEQLIGNKMERDQLIKMYRRENELRLSEEIQQKMDGCQMDDDDAYADLLDNLQKEVLKEFGYQGSDEDVSLFRQQLSFYPEDKELKSIPLYSKFNRTRDGPLQVGDELYDTTLCHINDPKSRVSLVEFYKQECDRRKIPQDSPLVIIAGSIT
eukprot:TRINITY_DN146_c0_g1_i1.p1 TRINITY_DN146_c0_g1~~TRINITY_DN146_c0_g1_i1.p1  ORF type:complete len:249 (-),score=69.59 TRINITY_DN146_c0_g1_i1:565-1311(-)